MIMDSEVLAAAVTRYSSGELKSFYFTEHYQKIFKWIIRYHTVHGKPPRLAMEDIWQRRKKAYPLVTQKLIEQYLLHLNEKYISFQEENLDPLYIRKEVIPDFIREREITARLDKAQQRLERGEFEEAEKLLSEYKPVTEIEENENLGVILPLTLKDIEDAKKNGEENTGDVAFEFEGDLGKLVGPLRKSWLVAVSGVEKSGKSFLLDEIGFDAAIFQEKKVLKINLELSAQLQRLRTHKRLSLTCDRHQAGECIYPVFDCENNQYGTCAIRRIKRRSGIDLPPWHNRKKPPLLSAGSHVQPVEYFTGWTVCQKCRDNPHRKNPHQTTRFIPTIWFDHCQLKSIKERQVKRAIKRNTAMVGLDNFRVKCFPRFSVNFDEVRSFIMRYIDKTKWKPDIILFDYVDILAAEHTEARIDVDNKWKKASRLAGELNCLVVNADQANKAARSQYQLDSLSTSESKTKDAHLDIRIALNQTDDEKDLGVARINVLFHRHQEFSPKNEVLITQRLQTSQPLLDNVRIYQRQKKYFVVGRRD
jgi:replicative DNA helicase